MIALFFAIPIPFQTTIFDVDDAYNTIKEESSSIATLLFVVKCITIQVLVSSPLLVIFSIIYYALMDTVLITIFDGIESPFKSKLTRQYYIDSVRLPTLYVSWSIPFLSIVKNMIVTLVRFIVLSLRTISSNVNSFWVDFKSLHFTSRISLVLLEYVGMVLLSPMYILLKLIQIIYRFFQPVLFWTGVEAIYNFIWRNALHTAEKISPTSFIKIVISDTKSIMTYSVLFSIITMMIAKYIFPQHEIEEDLPPPPPSSPASKNKTSILQKTSRASIHPEPKNTPVHHQKPLPSLLMRSALQKNMSPAEISSLSINTTNDDNSITSTQTDGSTRRKKKWLKLSLKKKPKKLATIAENGIVSSDGDSFAGSPISSNYLNIPSPSSDSAADYLDDDHSIISSQSLDSTKRKKKWKSLLGKKKNI
jgi:hypothetical protein